MGMPARPMGWGRQVTKKMVGKEDDVEADLPLMDLGAMEGGMEEELVAAWVFCGEFLCPNKENNLWTPTTHGKMMV